MFLRQEGTAYSKGGDGKLQDDCAHGETEWANRNETMFRFSFSFPPKAVIILLVGEDIPAAASARPHRVNTREWEPRSDQGGVYEYISISLVNPSPS